MPKLFENILSDSQEQLPDDIVLGESINDEITTTVLLEYRHNKADRVKIIQSAKNGKIIRRNTSSGLFPKVAAGLIGVGLARSAYRQYVKNKRNTLNFWTKNRTEHTLHKNVVRDLMKTGHYRKERDTYIDGGYLLVLKRI